MGKGFLNWIFTKLDKQPLFIVTASSILADKINKYKQKLTSIRD